MFGCTIEITSKSSPAIFWVSHLKGGTLVTIFSFAPAVVSCSFLVSDLFPQEKINRADNKSNDNNFFILIPPICIFL